MVSVEHGKPREVPQLKLDTEWKRCRFEAAEHRKVLRLKKIIILLVACIRKRLNKIELKKIEPQHGSIFFSSLKFNVLFHFSKIISELGGDRDNNY